MKRRSFIQLMGAGAMGSSIFTWMGSGALQSSSKNLIKTGYPELDLKVRGFAPGELIVIGGRPSMGKTHFALRLLRNSYKSNRMTAYFSLDSSTERIVSKIADQEYKDSVRSSQIDAELRPILNASQKISTFKYYLEDNPDLTTQSLQTELNKMISNEKIELVIVDYLQLMRPAEKHRTREEAIQGILSGLKKIAVQNKVAVVVLVQLVRSNRKDKRPQIEDFKASGPVVSGSSVDFGVVDKAIMLFRENYYNSDVMHNQLEYHVVKNNVESTGVVFAGWSRPTKV